MANMKKAEMAFIAIENPEWRDEFTPEELAVLANIDEALLWATLEDEDEDILYGEEVDYGLEL